MTAAAPVPPELHDLVGQTLAGTHRERYVYRLEHPIDAGSQAVAFLATRLGPSSQDLAVVKVFRESFVRAHPEASRLVLQKESVALARLAERVPPSPYVVRFLDSGELQRPAGLIVPWLALEYVHGGPGGTNLKQRVQHALAETRYAFPPERVRRLVRGLVLGLEALHEAGVIHRDLKPSNVLVCGHGEDELAKVADLGVARASGMAATFGVGTTVGTVGYAPPEQRDAARLGPWSDVFSLAALTYFVIAGEGMFGGSSYEIMGRAARGQMEPLERRARVHPAFRVGDRLFHLSAVLGRAVRPEPSERPPTPRAFWAALEPLLVDTPRVDEAPRSLPSLTMDSVPRATSWAFRLRHRPPASLGLTAVAFDPDGHAMAAGERGLWYWEGSCWLPVAPPPGVTPGAITRLARVGPGRWLAILGGGEVLLFSPYGTDARLRAADPSVTVAAAAVRGEGAFSLVLQRADGSSQLTTHRQGAWHSPVALSPGTRVHGAAPAGPDADWVVGEGPDGRGALFLVRLGGPAERLPINPPVPLVAVATNAAGRGAALSANGAILRLAHGAVQSAGRGEDTGERLSLAVSPEGDLWLAGPSGLLHEPGASAGPPARVWLEPGWATAIVGLAAFSGSVLAASREGTVVTGHDALTPASPPAAS